MGKILVVDDDPMMRKLLARVLRDVCDAVVVAGTVEEALSALDGDFEIVITDINLGGQSGVDVARAAAMRRPPLPVIAMSGHASEMDTAALAGAGIAAFVAKPFLQADILQVVDGVRAPRNLDLDTVVRRVVGGSAMPAVLDAVRRSMVFEALSRTGGNKAKSAQLLGISRQHLQNILARGKV